MTRSDFLRWTKLKDVLKAWSMFKSFQKMPLIHSNQVVCRLITKTELNGRPSFTKIPMACPWFSKYVFDRDIWSQSCHAVYSCGRQVVFISLKIMNSIKSYQKVRYFKICISAPCGPILIIKTGVYNLKKIVRTLGAKWKKSQLSVDMVPMFTTFF